MNYTYILKCKDGTYYTGWTNNLNKRLKDHNDGKGAKYTKARLPVSLIYYEEFQTKEEAMSREYAIKRMTRSEKSKLISEYRAVINTERGQNVMSVFENYEQEVKEKWGKTDAYREHKEKTKNYSKQKWDDLAQGMDHIMAEFAVCMKNGEEPGSHKARSLAEKLQNHITENYYYCTNEILAGLGQMYVVDERFKVNIDKYAEGTAEFICKAIKVKV